MVKVDDPRDIQQAYDNLGNPAESYGTMSPGERAKFDQIEAGERDLQELEKPSTDKYSKNNSGLSEKAYDSAIRDGEQTDGKWADNTSKQAPTSSTKQNSWGKTKAFFKKRSATMVIVMLLGGAAAVPFLGSTTLPFAMLGNMDAKSMLLYLSNYTNDYYNFRIFGSQSSVNTTAKERFAGLSETDVKQLTANKVELQGGTKVDPSCTGSKCLKTYTSIRYSGGKWISPETFEVEMKSNPGFRRAVKFTKGSYWKAYRGVVGANVKSLFRINPNPDLDGSTPEERNKKLVQNVADGDATVSKGAVTTDDDTSDAQKEKLNSGTESIAGELGDEIDDLKAQVSEGTVPNGAAANSNRSNIALALESTVLDPDATKSLGSKIWSFANSLDIADTVCTVYQTANTATTIAKTVAVANAVRWFATYRSTIEKYKAGNGDSMGAMEYLMNILLKPDPVTGMKFDATPAAAMLFSGQLSADPSPMNALGGQAMISLIMAMHSLHVAVGGGNASLGKTALTNSCNLATNLGVQIIATVAGNLFSGGSLMAIKTGFSTALKVVKEKLLSDMIKKFGKKVAEDAVAHFAEKGILRTLGRDAWKGFTGMWGSMSWIEKTGFLVAGTSTIGMAYLANELSGANIAGATENGITAMSMIGTGNDATEASVALGSGGHIGTNDQVSAYQSEQKSLQDAYIADMKYDAKNTPFDTTNPYSALGAAVFAAQKTIGISASMSIVSTLQAVASLPFKLPSLTSAHATSEPTSEEITAQVGDEYSIANNIALTVNAVSHVIFEKTISFETFLDTFVFGDNPQVTYTASSGDPEEGTYTVNPGTPLAEYQENCRKPGRTDPNEETSSGESTYYDMAACTTNRNAKFDDALAYIAQVSADVATTGAATAATGTCPTPGSTVVDITRGWDKDAADSGKESEVEKTITLCAITGTSMQVHSGWKDTRYQGTSSKNISEIVVNADAAQGLINANNEYKKTHSGGLSASIGYRSVEEQCSFFVNGRNSYGSNQESYYKKYCLPNKSWLQYPGGNWVTDRVISNHLMGHSIDFLSESESWMRQCMQKGMGDEQNRCYGFYDDVKQSGHGDSAHFTYSPKN